VSVAALGPGPHALRVSGIAPNCALDAPLPTPSVTAGVTTQVVLHVVCRQYLSNAIVYTSGEFGGPEVMVMRLDGSRRERLTTDQQVYSAPAIAPDGERIAVAARIGGSWSGICVMDAHGRGLAKVVGRSTFDGDPEWSPDGTKIAFRSESAGPFGAFGRIWVVNADGSGLRQLSSDTEEYTYDTQPAWSPDGSTVLFARSGDLYTVRADGTGEALLMSCRLACAEPTWSPDGRRIAYVMYTDADGDGVAEGHMDIYVMNADGSGSQRLTTSAAQDDSPAWSPDGTRIVFRRSTDGDSQLYRVLADGTDEVKLSASRSDAQPAWSPVP
jgi:TolB protein